MEMVFTNARVVTRDAVVAGSVKVRKGIVEAVEEEAGRAAGGLDCEGDYLLPGLVEMHTDNLEKCLVPRPGVLWPSAAALIAHDRQVAGAGITTVLDAVFIGEYRDGGMRRDLLRRSIDAVNRSAARGLLLADHGLHLRCEVSDGATLALFEPLAAEPRLRLVSLMDHTPGQRQWSNLAKYRLFHRDKKWTDQEFEADLASRREAQEAFAHTNRKEIVAICRDRGLPMASHDDTLPEHVAEAVGDGISISEFPTTETAARNARRAGMRIVMGAPNLVRGDSHSGNVSALALGRKGLLDGLSSDYVPASLLHGAFLATERLGWPLPEAVATVSANIADFLGLADRGRIAPGRRADLIRVTLSDGLPVVRSVWREGRRVC